LRRESSELNTSFLFPVEGLQPVIKNRVDAAINSIRIIFCPMELIFRIYAKIRKNRFNFQVIRLISSEYFHKFDKNIY
jgi:hypothetical protein